MISSKRRKTSRKSQKRFTRDSIEPAWIALVEILKRLEEQPYHWPVGRTRFQKIANFSSEQGLPLGLDYHPTTVKDGDELDTAKLRLKQIRQALKETEQETGTHLELVDMGTQTGTTFPIHAKMYDAIASADIILIDLTGVRPKVCVEAGFALRNHEKNRLIFIFQPTDTHKTVPFDLNTFRYELFKDTGEIPEKIKPHITEILRGAAVGL